MSRRALGKHLGSTPQEPTINITPLIDVVFVILIAFIVIAPMMDLDRIQLASSSTLPSKQSVHLSDTSPIQIHVYNDNTVSLNNQKIDLSQLRRMLIQAKRAHPGAKPQLFHDKKAYFGTYQAVKNALESTGFQEMDIVLSPS